MLITKNPNSILIIEDDRESNDNIAYFLQKRFTHVISAYDGEEGWTRYNEEGPDLIITDIEMPKINGLKLIQKIRKNDPNIPIIVLSAYTHQDYLFKAVTLKLDNYLIKPITYAKLNDALNLILQKTDFHRGSICIDGMGTAYYHYESKTGLIEGKHVSLTNKEILLLELLIENRNNVLQYDHIEEILYNATSVTRNALKCTVRDLRKKLPSIHIQSIAKVGYKLL
ncbi:MAG TPA: response regulator [Sulfuricurvum sp.]|nr:response regulator [Sulfuricurvum sp.]